MESAMKLLMENWRKYLNEEGEDPGKEKDFLDLLNQKRQERAYFRAVKRSGRAGSIPALR